MIFCVLFQSGFALPTEWLDAVRMEEKYDKNTELKDKHDTVFTIQALLRKWTTHLRGECKRVPIYFYLIYFTTIRKLVIVFCFFI